MVLNRGRGDCQRWFVPGWAEGGKLLGGFECAGLRVVRMGDLSGEAQLEEVVGGEKKAGGQESGGEGWGLDGRRW